MLCYDASKCRVVSGPQLARLTQRQKGFVSPSQSVALLRNGLGRVNGLGGFMDLLNTAGSVPGPQQPFVAGAAAAGSLIDTVKNFFGGLFGKNPDKAQFDSVRQNVWNQFAAIVDAVDKYKAAGQLTREQLQNYMRSLQTLIENFNAYYNRVRAVVTPAYGDSRFHDFYDVFQAKYDEWNQDMLSMPGGGFFGGGSGGFIGGITGSLSKMDGTQMLMLGALVLAVMSGSRRSRA